MKNLISFITFLIFLHGITNHMTTTEAKEESHDPVLRMTTTEAKEVSHDPVLDVDGNELVEGDNYTLVSLIRPWRGVHYYPIPNENCTYGVSQLILFEGIPVTFKLLKYELEGTIIRESTDLNIQFSPSVGCAPSTVWKVSRYEYEEKSTQLVTTGGVAGYPGFNSLFNIRKAGYDYYKFVYCPPKMLCIDVGISPLHDERSLALNGETTFHVMFSKFKPKHEHEKY